MKIYIGKGWEFEYLNGTLSPEFNIINYLRRLCYEMALYIKFNNIREILGDIECLDMQDLKNIIDNGTIIIKYPNPQIPNLITGYLKGSHYDRKITPFLIYAIFITAKYNLGCIEKNTTTREKEIDFVRDMIRIFAVANSESFMFKAFVNASGVSPRQEEENLKPSNVLNQNASLASEFIMDLIGEEKIACRAPIVLFVVANFIHKHEIGNWQNFADHKIFRDYEHFHDEEFAQTIEFAPEFEKDKKAKELILKMLDEVEALNLSEEEIGNLNIDTFMKTSPKNFKEPDDVVRHVRQIMGVDLKYNLDDIDINVSFIPISYGIKLYEIYYGEVDFDVYSALNVGFYNYITRRKVRPILFCINQIVNLIVFKFIKMKNLDDATTKILMENFTSSVLTDLKTYDQWGWF